MRPGCTGGCAAGFRSDAGIGPRKPRGALPEALADLVAAGVPPADALATATSHAAHSCGLGRRKGRLRAGYDADLLVVDGNPLDGIAGLRRRADWAGPG